ncbi:MAG: hypothetical protein OXI80_08400 [Caldilineaceae bacterium]|nr:hypothetical protein [Caldilineaceae bacterium]MDE0337678.1 hypothetical protein [Caldilineaceae bacterium]
MARKKHTPEQVINKLREAEGAIAEASTVAEAARLREALLPADPVPVPVGLS